MKPLICLVDNMNGKITLTVDELREICDKFYDEGFEDGKKNAVIVAEKSNWTEPMITTVYAGPARPYPYNYGDTTTTTACINEERSEDE